MAGALLSVAVFAPVAALAQHTVVPLPVVRFDALRLLLINHVYCLVVRRRWVVHVYLALPQHFYRILRRASERYRTIAVELADVDVPALRRLVWLYLLAHQAWVQTLRHLRPLRRPVLVCYVLLVAHAASYLLELFERHCILRGLLLVLLLACFLASVTAWTAVRGGHHLLGKVILRHILGRFLELSIAHSLVICVHPVLLAAEVDLVLIDYELWEEQAIGTRMVVHLATFASTSAARVPVLAGSVTRHR